jgi:hypothetical protein
MHMIAHEPGGLRLKSSADLTSSRRAQTRRRVKTAS